MIHKDSAHPNSMPNQGVRYAYKASTVGAAWQFELDDAGLHWRTGRHHGVMAYRDVANVVMSYRPTSMQAHRYRMTIRSNKGFRLPVLSVTAKGPALVEPQSVEYCAFVLELHRRLAAAGVATTFHAGLSPLVFGGALIASILVLLATAALLIRALLIGSFGGASFMVGFSALFVWQIGGFIQRNKPEGYTALQPPERLLPQDRDSGAPMRLVRRLLRH